MSLNAPEESNSSASVEEDGVECAGNFSASVRDGVECVGNFSASVEDGVECVDDGRVDNLERVHCTAALLRRAEGTARVNMVRSLLAVQWDDGGFGCAGIEPIDEATRPAAPREVVSWCPAWPVPHNHKKRKSHLFHISPHSPNHHGSAQS
jgi:hypothetical protein